MALESLFDSPSWQSLVFACQQRTVPLGLAQTIGHSEGVRDMLSLKDVATLGEVLYFKCIYWHTRLQMAELFRFLSHKSFDAFARG